MCVIVYQPPGQYLEKQLAQKLWNANPDGGGFSFVDGEEITTAKSMNFPAFWSQFESARSANRNAPFLLHFRIATHGAVNLDNVHPFTVDKHTVLAHNGIIHGVPDYKDDRSDTRVFVDEVLPYLQPTWLDDPTVTHMVEDWIGWSKMLFLTADPELSHLVYILNEKDGHWIDGLWYSNRSGQELPKPEPKTYKVHSTKGWKYASAPTVTYPSKSVKNAQGGRTVETFDKWLDENVVPEGMPAVNVKTDDIGILYNQMHLVRDNSWLFQPFGYSLEFGWLCYGCDEELSVPSGECLCWSKICLTCYLFAAECGCPAHLKRETKHLDDLGDEQQERFALAEPIDLQERKPL